MERHIFLDWKTTTYTCYLCKSINVMQFQKTQDFSKTRKLIPRFPREVSKARKALKKE